MENVEERMHQVPNVALGEKAGWGYGVKAVKVTRWAEPVESEYSRKAGNMLHSKMRPPSPRVSSNCPLPKLLSPQAKLMPPGTIGLPWWLRRERICLQCRRPGFNPWVRKIPSRREWLPTLQFLPGEFHGQRRLVGYSP